MATPEQRDRSSAQAYWLHAAEYGFHYYLAGRYTTHGHMVPVCGNLMHHAVEMLIKSALAREMTWAQIQELGAWPPKGYRHNIRLLWQAFKDRPEADTSLLWVFDEVIGWLHKWEDIRYPETLVRIGGLINISPIVDLQPHEMTHTAAPPDTQRDPLLPPWDPPEEFRLILPQVDRLVTAILVAAQVNPEALRNRLNHHGAAYLWLHNTAPPIAPASPPA